jgi:hypothetical protein
MKEIIAIIVALCVGMNSHTLKSLSMKHYLYILLASIFIFPSILYTRYESFSTTSYNFYDDFDAGDFTNNPHWDFSPGGTGCHTTGIAEIINGQLHVIKTNVPGCGTGT